MNGSRTGGGARGGGHVVEAVRRAAGLPDVARTARRRLRSPIVARAARRRAGAWLAAVAVGVSVAVVVADADAARRRWGATAPVLVAERPLAAGDEVGPDDVSLRHWPVAVVPRGALDALPDGRRTAVDLVPGDVVVSSRLARPGVGAAGSLAGDGAAVTVPLGPSVLPIAVGDRVDVLAPGPDATDPWDEEPDRVQVVARAARVVAVADGHATLVVERSEVERTAAAILAGTLTVALTG